MHHSENGQKEVDHTFKSIVWIILVVFVRFFLFHHKAYSESCDVCLVGGGAVI